MRRTSRVKLTWYELQLLRAALNSHYNYLHGLIHNGDLDRDAETHQALQREQVNTNTMAEKLRDMCNRMDGSR